MKKFRIEYWIERNDEATDFEEIIEALDAASALKQFLFNHKNKIIKPSIKVTLIN